QAQGRRGHPDRGLPGGEDGHGHGALGSLRQGGQGRHRAGRGGPGARQEVPVPGQGHQQRGRVGAPGDGTFHSRQEPLRRAGRAGHARDKGLRPGLCGPQVGPPDQGRRGPHHGLRHREEGQVQPQLGAGRGGARQRPRGKSGQAPGGRQVR
ncbi:unnamed protein product, partial [Ixodes pacificus]